ncbi:MAG: hypothetical protein Q9163_005315 [Psora crenata]
MAATDLLSAILTDTKTDEKKKKKREKSEAQGNVSVDTSGLHRSPDHFHCVPGDNTEQNDLGCKTSHAQKATSSQAGYYHPSLDNGRQSGKTQSPRVRNTGSDSAHARTNHSPSGSSVPQTPPRVTSKMSPDMKIVQALTSFAKALIMNVLHVFEERHADDEARNLEKLKERISPHRAVFQSVSESIELKTDEAAREANRREARGVLIL